MDKQEPVAYVHLKEWLDGTLWPEDAFSQNPHEEMTPLYTASPKKEWVGLDGGIPGLGLVTEEFYNGMLFAEDYLREKNSG